MSKGRKRQDERRKNSPIRHCAEGHCCSPMVQDFPWVTCRKFMELQKKNLTPFNCPYYKV